MPTPHAKRYRFPKPDTVDSHGDGLIAVGGDLSPERLLGAYAQGIFPWFNADQPILWWCPDPRCVLWPNQLIIRRSLRQSLRNRGYRYSVDQAFAEVIKQCASNRAETWISPHMQQAYTALHQRGAAHSVEVWQQEKLVGGLYGVRIGSVFFGESMFSLARDASKTALVHLSRTLKPALIDCQLETPHLRSLGASTLKREVFIQKLNALIDPDKAVSPACY